MPNTTSSSSSKPRNILKTKVRLLSLSDVQGAAAQLGEPFEKFILGVMFAEQHYGIRDRKLSYVDEQNTSAFIKGIVLVEEHYAIADSKLSEQAKGCTSVQYTLNSL